MSGKHWTVGCLLLSMASCYGEAPSSARGEGETSLGDVEGSSTSSSDEEDQSSSGHGDEGLPPPEDEGELLDDAVPLPPQDIEGTAAFLAPGAAQVVYVNFDGATISHCNGCSDASTNRSYIVKGKFGAQSVNIPAWGTPAERAHVMAQLHAAFDPYRVLLTTRRPPAPPYQMLVIGHRPTTPNAGGVAPLDCLNSHPNDIAFVFNTSFGLPWVARAAVHEVAHSFGLDHMASSSDYMHPFVKGSAFTGGSLHPEALKFCIDGPQQNSPALLAQALQKVSLPCPEVTRHGGANRFATAVSVSKRLFPSGAQTAVLVSAADSNPDALSAAPLARRHDAPLLLTAAQQLSAETRQELLRLGVQQVFIVGGTAAVGATVEAELGALGIGVQRIAGVDRFDTAARVAAVVGSATGLAFIASGDNAHLIDALAASGAAAGLGAPVLFVTRDSVPQATAQALAQLGITRTIIAGGTASVSNIVAGALPNPVRANGANRYETAVKLAERALAEGLPSSHVFVSRGDKMPDALAAAAAGELIVLSGPSRLSDVAAFFLAQHAGSASLLGGPAALGSGVERDACVAVSK